MIFNNFSRLIPNYATRLRLRYFVHTGEFCFIVLTFAKQNSHLIHLCIRDLAVNRHLAAWLAFFVDAVSLVIGMCAQEQMFGVYTSSVITFMTYEKCSWNAKVDFVRNSMHLEPFNLARLRDLSFTNPIAIFIKLTRPLVTTAVRMYNQSLQLVNPVRIIHSCIMPLIQPGVN